MMVLYFSLECFIEPWGSNEMITIDGADLIRYAGMIQRKIDENMPYQYDDVGLMIHCDSEKPFAEKVRKAYPGVEEQDGTLVGTVTIETETPLSDNDISDLKSFLCDIFENEWGQELREEAIETECGKLYIGFQGADSKIENRLLDSRRRKSEIRMRLKRESANTKIRSFVERNKRFPSAREWTEANNLPCAGTIKRLFGVTPKEYLQNIFEDEYLCPQRNKWDAGEILAAFDIFIEKNSRFPKTSDMISDSQLPAPATIQRIMCMSPEELCDIRYPEFREKRMRAALTRFSEKHGYILSAKKPAS